MDSQYITVAGDSMPAPLVLPGSPHQIWYLALDWLCCDPPSKPAAHPCLSLAGACPCPAWIQRNLDSLRTNCLCHFFSLHVAFQSLPAMGSYVLPGTAPSATLGWHRVEGR